MGYIKCLSCGKEVQDTSSKCIYCGFDFEKLAEASNILLMVEEPKGTVFGSGDVLIIDEKTGEMLAELKFGDTFNLRITEPTHILVKKTAWKTGRAVLRGKPHATYLIKFKNGLFSSKIVIKDITDTIAIKEPLL